MQDEVADLLKKIDVPASAEAERSTSTTSKNADAEEVSKVLSSLSEKRTGAPGAPPAAAPGARAAATATGSAVISAELEGGVKVTADKATNALIIVASANDYETLVMVIKKLDIRRRQVFVEAVIMEIDVGKSLDSGGVARRDTGRGGGDRSNHRGRGLRHHGRPQQPAGRARLGKPFTFAGSGLVAGGIGGSVTLPTGRRSPPSRPFSARRRRTTT